MTREQIKALLESKGIDANVRLQGDQQSFKVTLKSSFPVPIENISESVVLARTKNHINYLFRSGCSNWICNL